MSTSRPIQIVRKHTYSRIRKGKVVRLRYAVIDVESGETIEFRDDLFYLHGGYGGAFPKVEEALEGKQVDESIELTLTPEESFGPRNPALVFRERAENLPPEAQQVGTRLDGHGPDGKVVPFVVTAVKGDDITVDGNHPLAGRTVRMVLEVLDIRDATEQELADGRPLAEAAAGTGSGS